MNLKTVSRICGFLYISTVLAFIVSNMVLKESLLDSENITNTFTLISDNAFQYRFAVSIDFLAMVAVMALAFSLYMILRPVNSYLAILALGLRIGEVVIQAGSKVPDYLLMTLSQSAVSLPGDGLAQLNYLGRVLFDGSTQALWLSFVFLSVGSLLNNFLFYKGKVIPASLAIYGLVSTAFFTLGSMAALFTDLPESFKMVMMLPLVLFELMLGFYLAIFAMKGESADKALPALSTPI